MMNTAFTEKSVLADALCALLPRDLDLTKEVGLGFVA